LRTSVPRPVGSRQVVALLGGFGLLLGSVFVVALLVAPRTRHFRNEFAGAGGRWP